MQWRRGPENGTIFRSLLGPSRTSKPTFLQNAVATKNAKKIVGYTHFGTQICKICGPSFGPRKWAWFSIPSLVVVPFLGPCNGLVSGSKIEPQSTPVSRALAVGAILSETIGGERQEASKTNRVVISCCPLWPRKWDHKVNGTLHRTVYANWGQKVGPVLGDTFGSFSVPASTPRASHCRSTFGPLKSLCRPLGGSPEHPFAGQFQALLTGVDQTM